MDQLLNLFGQMMRLPLDIAAAGANWISQMGQTGAPVPANGLRDRRVSFGQPANAGAVADTGAGAGAGTVPSQEGSMQVLIVFEVFHTIVDPERLQLAITETHRQLRQIFASGTVLASGAFAVGRGGFFLLNVASCEELLRLMSPGLNDNCTIKIWPILSFDQQLAVFQQIERMGLMKSR